MEVITGNIMQEVWRYEEDGTAIFLNGMWVKRKIR